MPGKKREGTNEVTAAVCVPGTFGWGDWEVRGKLWGDRRVGDFRP